MGNSVNPLEELIRVCELVQMTFAQLNHLQHVQPQQIASTSNTCVKIVSGYATYPVLKTPASLR